MINSIKQAARELLLGTPSRIQQIARKANPTIRAIITAGSSGPQWRTNDYDGYVKEGYNINADVYSCINKIAVAAKGIPWNVYKQASASAKPSVLEKHDLLKLLRRPNPFEGWGTFIEKLIGYYMLSGDGYVLRAGPERRNAPPLELYTLRPDRTIVDVDPNAPQGVGGFIFRAGSGIQRYKPDRVINGEPHHLVMHLKRFNPLDDWYGMSPIMAAARSIDQNNAAATWNLALMQNGAQLSGAIVFPDNVEVTDELFTRIQMQIDERHTSPVNAGRPIVLEGGVDWKEMGMKPVEMAWIEGQRLSTRRICSIFGVPPELVGDAQNKTYSNQKEARKALYLETVMPLLDEIADALNAWLVPLFNEDGLTVGYDKDQIEAIKDERGAVWDRALTAMTKGGITINEFREEVGKAPHPAPEADKLLIPNGVMPTAVDIDGNEEPSLLTQPSEPPTNEDEPTDTDTEEGDAEEA